MAQLDKLVGIQSVKTQIEGLCATAISDERRRALGIEPRPKTNHMLFLGNPGTGKTTFARMLHKFMYAFGVLPKDNFVEKNGLELKGRYVGHTAPNVKSAIADAMGGCLFLDEAYALVDSGGDSFSSEAIRTLLTEVENNRTGLMVVLAGYKDKMGQLMRADPGLNRRFPLRLDLVDYTPDEIHDIGLAEVVRIEGEMHAILDAQQIPDGDIATRVRVVMEDPSQQFANTDEGREEMIAYLESFDAKVMERVADFFITIPPQPLEIVRVPVHAQDSSAGGYYSSPALDGSRPGRFYINQKNTADNPRWTLPTLMIHEGSPGHHFQLSASQLIEDVPLLRRLSPFNAFTEGWALYSERIAKTDMGLYDDDPLGDLGRLQAEMFRAVRLVVDTGIHAKRWSREEAIEYMLAKTGMTEDEVTREIERYSVWPGQATGYKTGQLAILELREAAEAALGESFDIRQFHELLLMNGAMPLALLKDQVTTWIDAQR